MRRFQNILVVCGEGSGEAHALERAMWLASANGAAVRLVEIVHSAPGELSEILSRVFGSKGVELQDKLVSAREERLHALAAPFRAQGISVEINLVHEPGFRGIIQLVLRHGHDLVLKSGERSPGKPFFHGPDMHLMRKCPCPVWILNSATPAQTSRILAAVDPGPVESERNALAQTVMQLATSLARQDTARLDVMNVWALAEESALRGSLAPVPDTEVDKIVGVEKETSAQRLDQLTSGFAEFDDVMRVLHIKGVAEDVIPDHVAAEGIDTIIMGSVGRSGVSGLFIGNTAETILNRVACSVLTVKPEGFISPVTLDDPAAPATAKDGGPL